MAAHSQHLEDYLQRFEKKLPNWLGRSLKWIRQPRLMWIRVPFALILIIGGFLSFLPVLGIWMLPLGLMLLAQDVTPLQGPIVAAIAWCEKIWRKYRPS